MYIYPKSIYQQKKLFWEFYLFNFYNDLLDIFES